MIRTFFKVDGNYKPKDPRSSVNSQVQTPKEHDSKKHKLHISLKKKKKAGWGGESNKAARIFKSQRGETTDFSLKTITNILRH